MVRSVAFGVAFGMVFSTLILLVGLYIISMQLSTPDLRGLSDRVSAIERNLESNRVYPYGSPLYQAERPKSGALDGFTDPDSVDPYR